MRDYRKLRTFQLADTLVLTVYEVTRTRPKEEQYGLSKQLRRAAVSVPTNVVEGSARPTTGDYLHFLNIALGSSLEVAYLIGLTSRLGLLEATKADGLSHQYFELSKRLQTQIVGLKELAENEAARRRGPGRKANLA